MSSERKIEATSPKASVPASQAKASAPASQAKASAPAGQAKASAPASQAKASAPASQAKASAPASQAKASAPASQAKASVPASQAKASAPASQAKASVPASQAKASAPAGQAKASAPAGQAKASAPAGQAKASVPGVSDSKNAANVDQTKKDTGKEAVANEALAGEGLSAKEALAGEGLSEKEALVGEGLFEKEALVDEGLFDKEALAGEGLFDKEALAGEGLSAKEALAGEGLFDKEALAGEGLLNLEEAFKEFLIEMRRKLTTEKEEAGTNDNAAATAPDVNEAALEGMGTLDDEYSDSLINEEVSAPDEASDDEDIDDYSWVFDRLKEGRVGPEELEQVWDDDDDVIIVPVDGTEGSLAEEIDDVPPPPLPMPTPVAVVTQAEVTSSAALCKAAEGGRTGEADEAEAGEHGAGLVIESRNWHLGQNRRLFKVLMFLCPILLVSLLLNAWQVVARPEPRYFAVTRDLRIIEMPPLSEPVVESKSLTNWAGDVVIRALSLNFLTWRQTLSDLRGEFDPGGFESFMSSLKSGGHLEKIEKERLSLSALISGAPVVTMSAVKGGVMTWKMEMPLVLSYESSTGVVASQKLLAEVVVQRTETSRNPRGVVIRQIVLTKAG